MPIHGRGRDRHLPGGERDHSCIRPAGTTIAQATAWLSSSPALWSGGGVTRQARAMPRRCCADQHNADDGCYEQLDRALNRTALETVKKVEEARARIRAERESMHDDGCAEGGPCGFCAAAL